MGRGFQLKKCIKAKKLFSFGHCPNKLNPLGSAQEIILRIFSAAGYNGLQTVGYLSGLSEPSSFSGQKRFSVPIFIFPLNIFQNIFVKSLVEKDYLFLFSSFHKIFSKIYLSKLWLTKIFFSNISLIKLNNPVRHGCPCVLYEALEKKRIMKNILRN